MAAFSSHQWAEKIERLKAMAEDPALSAEARQSYAARVADLMTRHGIDEHDLAAARDGRPPTGLQVGLWPYAVTDAGGLAFARAAAVTAIATALGCRCATQHVGPGRPATIAIVGAQADITTLRTLLPLVLRQAEYAVATVAARGRRGRSYLGGFLSGYGQAVAQRITQKRQDLTNDTPGAAIVLADRARAVDEAFTTHLGPHLERRTTHAVDQAGTADGYDAGRRADLGDPRMNNTGARRTLDQ